MSTKFRNPYGEDRVVPALGRIVEAGEEIEVDDKDLAAQFAEAGWEKATTTKKKAD